MSLRELLKGVGFSFKMATGLIRGDVTWNVVEGEEIMEGKVGDARPARLPSDSLPYSDDDEEKAGSSFIIMICVFALMTLNLLEVGVLLSETK